MKGHTFDLDTLAELFFQGDPTVGVDSEGYFLASVTLDGLIPDASRLSEAAMSLLHRVNGVARVLNFDSRPVCLSGRFADDSGGRLTVVPLGTVEERERALPVTALVGGQPQSAHSPPAPGYVQLAETDPHVAEVLEILGKADPAPDWVGLFKVLEIVRDSAGGLTRLKTMGWIPSAKLEAFSASANHPAISGDQARHARMPGTPPITRVLTLAQARETIGNLVAHWIDALSMDTSPTSYRPAQVFPQKTILTTPDGVSGQAVGSR